MKYTESTKKALIKHINIGFMHPILRSDDWLARMVTCNTNIKQCYAKEKDPN
jgi:hypothetical protein